MGILDKIFGGGEQKQTTEIDPKLKEALYDNLARAQAFSRIGYQPYYGPSVAAMTPSQTSAMANTSSLASALGMQAPQSQNLGMPAPRDYGNGMMAYSSGDLFDQSLAELQKRRPAQYQAMQDMFIDPQTGSMAKYDQGVVEAALNSMPNGLLDPSATSSGGSDASTMPVDPNAGYNNSQKLRYFFEKNPWAKSLPLPALMNAINNMYLNSEAGINASQGGSILTGGGSDSYLDYDSGYGVGSGLGQGGGISGATTDNWGYSDPWSDSGDNFWSGK